MFLPTSWLANLGTHGIYCSLFKFVAIIFRIGKINTFAVKIVLLM